MASSLSYTTVMSWMTGTMENSATARAIMIFSFIGYLPTEKCRASLLNSMDGPGSTITCLQKKLPE